MRSLIDDAEMREDAKTEKQIRKEAKRRGIKLDITKIGKPTLTASSTLENVNLVPGVNATTDAPGSTYTGESAHPTRGIIPNGGDSGNLTKMAVGKMDSAKNDAAKDGEKYGFVSMEGSDLIATVDCHSRCLIS